MGFRDRFYTPQTAKAILSWRILLGVGLGVAAGLAGLPVGLAVVAGAAVYAASVATAIPEGRRRVDIDPFMLSEPWRRLMQNAQGSSRKLRQTVSAAGDGPLRETLVGIAEQLERGLVEAWEVAKRGDEIDDAVRLLDPTALRSKLATLEQRAATSPSGESDAAIASVERQIESADRLKRQAAEAADSLRLTQTQLDELVSRASEVLVGSVDTEAYRREVDDLVIRLEALHQAVEETPHRVSSLLKSNLTVAMGTALSRVTGLLRVFVFAYVIGQTLLADAYKIANETPNIVYDLLLGGVLSATLVPLFSSFLGGDDEEPDEHATNVVITVATTLMVGLTVVAVALAPLIFRLYTLNVADTVDVDLFRQVGTTLTRIFLLQILFYGLTGIANAYLNSRRRFFAAAWSPILPNLIIIVTLLSLPGAGDTAWELGDVIANDRLRWTLGLGATAGIAAMAVVVVPAMVGAGLRFRPAWEWKHPAVRKLLVLSVWTIGFVAANQVALLVIRNLALGEGEGIASAYFDAFTWFVLPHGLLAVSIATTFQPEMARAVVRKDRDDFVQHTSLGVRMIVLLTLPAAAGMFVLREPIIGLMQRGQFDAVDALNTSRALAGLSIGLVGFSVYLFVLRGFYAHQDTRTPFVLNVGENLLNIVFAFVLVGRWGVLGLGLAYAFAYLLSSVWALTVLRNKVRGFSLRPIIGSLWKMMLAAVLMAEAVWLVTNRVSSDTGWDALVQIVVGGVVGVAVYVAVLLALRVDELSAVRRRST